MATVLQLSHSFVHPSINCEDLHPELAAARANIPVARTPASIGYALKTSFGFGDVNACIVFGNYPR